MVKHSLHIRLFLASEAASISSGVASAVSSSDVGGDSSGVSWSGDELIGDGIVSVVCESTAVDDNTEDVASRAMLSSKRLSLMRSVSISRKRRRDLPKCHPLNRFGRWLPPIVGPDRRMRSICQQQTVVSIKLSTKIQINPNFYFNSKYRQSNICIYQYVLQ